jgi:hypothetical protein
MISAKPADNVGKVSVGMKSMVALELSRDVRGFGVIEKDNANPLDHATSLIDAMT